MKHNQRPPKNPTPIRDKPAESDPDNPVNAETSPESQTKPAKETHGQKRQDPTPHHKTFFEQVQSIARDDWGTRAKIKLYRLAPIIDRTRGSEFKYVTIYNEPITEENLKIDHGSGRYRLYLNFKGPAGPEKEVDVIDIDILDMNHPPKVPPGEWVDDARNKKWAWARTPVAPPAPTPGETTNVVLDAVRTVNDIRRDMRDEMTPPASTTPAADPMVTALSMAKELLQMRADNPMVDVMRDELQAMRKEIADERAENRKLQSEMRTAPTAPPPTNRVKEIVETVNELEPLLKKFMPTIQEGVQTVVNGRRPKWWEAFIEAAGPRAVDVAGLLLSKIMERATAPVNGAAPQTTPAVAPSAINPAQPVSPDAQARIIAFLRMNSKPMQNYFEDFVQGDSEAPETFSQWIFDGWAEGPLNDARAVGVEPMIAYFKTLPAWPMIAPQEPKLREFIAKIIQWQPPQEDHQPQGDDEPSLINLD